MGQIVRAACLECGERFEMSRGGGFKLHQALARGGPDAV
jgi:hypothetical protein